MPGHSLSHETRQALDNLRAYLSGPNESVQYAFGFLADMVTQSPVVMLGGIQAGSVPASGIVTDPNGQAFPIDPSATGTGTGSISLDLATGELSASWTVGLVTSTVTGYVRCVSDLDAPPSDRFLFLIPQDHAGFYILTTTNI